jgi:hypothetical protein
MSQPDNFTPPPPVTSSAPLAAAFHPPGGLEYMRMYSYIFDNPNRIMNLLLGAVCNLIPVVGPVVLLGYQYEVVLGLLASRGSRYPDFDFNRFADYLLRGLWPFLIQLIASILLFPVYFIFIGIPVMILIGLAGAAGDDGGPVILFVGLPLLLLFVIPLCILPTILFLPLMLRAGLALDFAEGFNMGWAVDFLKKIWFELILAMLFLAFTGAVLGILGLLACYIGLFVVMPIVFLAQAHLLYQIYQIAVTRGTPPVPYKTGAPQPTTVPPTPLPRP